jgi:hypothetical protein
MDRPITARAPARARTSRWRGVTVLAALVGLLLLAPAPAQAKAVWGWSPGVKLGWTFGHGLTYGIELSFIRLPDLELHGNIWHMAASAFGQLISETYGVVINVDTNFKNMFKMRVGAEWVGPGLGLEVGPMLVKNKHGWHAGLGITPWIGYTLFVYYTATVIFDRSPNMHELGLYLKSPLLGFGKGDGVIDHDDDFD